MKPDFMVNILLKYLQLLRWILLSGVFLLSCQKDYEDEIPVVKIYSPFENQVFSSADSIHVKATIRDDHLITALKIVLTDENFISAQTAVYIYPNSASYELDLIYYLEDNITEGGTHYMLIRADDGNNFKNAYQPVELIAKPLLLENILVLTKPSYGTLELSAIKLDGIVESIYLFNGDFAGSAIHPTGKQFFLAGMNQLNLLAFDLDENFISWQLENIPALPMHNKGCLYFDEYLYSSFNYDYLYGYNLNGAVIFNASTESTDKPGRIFRKGNYVLVDFQKRNTEQPFIKTISAITGNEKQRILTNFKIVEFHDIGAEEVIITANSLNSGRILKYNYIGNTLTELKTISENILSSVQPLKDQILIGTPNGILLYLTDQDLLVEMNYITNTRRMVFDNLNDNLYLVTGSEVQVYKYPTMVYQKTFPFSDTIVDVHLQFKK